MMRGNELYRCLGKRLFGQGTSKCKGPEAEHAYCEGRPCGRREVSKGGVLEQIQSGSDPVRPSGPE